MAAMEGSSTEKPESQEVQEVQDEAAPAVPLDTVDVAELQAFNERKAWIIEKTKYLESLTPLEPLRSDNLVYPERAPGLPTLEELRVWTKELRALEKETDQFDKVDLGRLRNTARAAANRHLSPEDTDLVDLTLSTLLALDHLLEAISQRSEQLELFGHRVRWEDQRTECEQERRTLAADLNNFIAGQARWSPDAYEEVSQSSITSIPEHVFAAATSTPPPSTRSGTPALSQSSSSRSTPTMAYTASRSQRFQMGQHLAADASRLYMRASNLRQGRVEVAGKLLDRIISLKKVPDQLLDEQDRLENDTDLLRRSLGEFALALSEQWIVADRVYSDCVRHQNEAHAIIADLGRAGTKPPNQRLHASLSYRISTLESRLSTTGYDVLVFRYIPQPTHDSFVEQEHLNERIAQTLSEEFETARNLVRLAGTRVKEYYDAVKTLHRADKIKEELGNRKTQLSKLVVRLLRGGDNPDNTTAAPDISTEACLEPGRHNAYLASLPALMKEVDESGRYADKLVRAARSHLPALKSVTLAPGYMDSCIQAINSLEAERHSLTAAKETASTLSSAFKTVFVAWVATQDIQRSVEKYQNEVQEGLERDRWRTTSPLPRGSSPPTPETPSNRTFADSRSAPEVLAQLGALSRRLNTDVDDPIKIVNPELGDGLRSHFEDVTNHLRQDLSDLQSLAQLWQRVRAQAATMKDVMEEANAIEAKLTSLLQEADEIWQNASSSPTIPDLVNSTAPLSKECAGLRQEIEAFCGGLASRVPFVSASTPSRSSVYKVRSPKSSTTLSMPQTPPELSSNFSLTVPFDPTALDEAVRSQVNVRSATLTGGMHNLDNRMKLLGTLEEVRSLETCLTDAHSSIDAVSKSLKVRMDVMASLAAQTESESVEEIQLALDALDQEATELVGFASNLEDVLRKAVAPSQEAYDVIGRGCGKRDDEDLRRVMKPRLAQLQQLEGREDQLHKDTAAALRELHDVSTALATRLATLETEEAEKEALRRRTEEESKEPEVDSPAADADHLQFIGDVSDDTVELSISDLKTRTDLVPVLDSYPADTVAVVVPAGIPIQEEKLDGTKHPDLPPGAGNNDQIEVGSGDATGNRSENSPISVPSVVITAHHGVLEHSAVLPAEHGTTGEKSQGATFSEPRRSPQAIMKNTPPSATPVTPSVGGGGFPDTIVEECDTVIDLGDDEEAGDVFEDLGPMEARKDTLPQTATGHVLSGLKARLDNLKIDVLAHSTSPETQFNVLPTTRMLTDIQTQVSAIEEKVQQVEVTQSDAASTSIRADMQQALISSYDLFPRLHSLASFVSKVDECDAGINDIISRLDDYPNPPSRGSSTSLGQDLARAQLNELLDRVSVTVQSAMEHAEKLADDFRVLNEKARIEQTWSEVREEANDILDPTFIRTHSVLSLSSLSSSTSMNDGRTNSLSKPNLSRQSSTSFLSGRSSVLSTSTSGYPRMPSTGITPSSRSVSGPLPRTPASRLPRPTQSPTPSTVLRQRAESVASTYSARPRQSLDSYAPPWARGTTETRRRKSSISSETTPTRPRNMSLSSSWSRTPRQSFGSPMFTPREPKKRPYVANPKNKLDVAVGNVINRLPVNVNVRPLPGYKDQSGKYYIGDTNPKPYFCRILRSQTVMVRVGGGWMELSKFIRGHFADLFRILPPGPRTPPVTSGEPWISSATLLKAKAAASPSQAAGSPLVSPITLSPAFGDPKTPSPSAHQGDLSSSTFRSLGSPSTSPTSPLASLQFLRKADEFGRLAQSPTLRASTSKSRSQSKNTPRTPVWRP